MKKFDKRGVILIIIATIIFIIAFCMYINSNKNENENEIKVKINHELNEEKKIYLLKNIEKYLQPSSNLEENSFSSEEMISFAASYMEVDDKYREKLLYNDEGNIITVNKNDILEVVEYIFGVNQIDFNTLSYKTTERDILVPINIQGGDVQIYKYKTTQYDEAQNVYIVHIDCLELDGRLDKSLLSASQVEYDEQDVIYKILLKYKIVDDRKILLAYDIVNNIIY